MVEEAVASSPTAAAGLGEGASAAAAAAAAQTAETRGSRDLIRAGSSHGSGHASATSHSTPRPPAAGMPVGTVATAAIKEVKTMSTIEWAKRIIELKGPTGLYSGYSIHLLRDAIGTAMYFSGYETCKVRFLIIRP